MQNNYINVFITEIKFRIIDLINLLIETSYADFKSDITGYFILFLIITCMSLTLNSD